MARKPRPKRHEPSKEFHEAFKEQWIPFAEIQKELGEDEYVQFVIWMVGQTTPTLNHCYKWDYERYKHMKQTGTWVWD